MKRFHKINIEITNVCNLQCSFCPEVIRAKDFMDEVLFEKIIKEVAPLTEQVCFHLMGEPLLHPKLQSFIDICEKENTKIYLVSNGILLTDKVKNILYNKTINQINFSLHSFSDNYKEKDNTDYLNNIFYFTKKCLEIRPDMYINFRLWNLNDPSVTENIIIQKNLEILEKIESRFGVDIKAKLDKSFDIRLQKSYKLVNRLYMHFDTEFIWPSLDLNIISKVGTCKGLSTHFGILSDGTVVPCCLDKEGKIPLGNVNEKSILEILNSDKAKSILKGFKENKLLEDLCQRCPYIERFKGN